MRQFTVLIPSRERCDVLPDALETCVRQNYERLRIIVSDNDSKDATREVVEEFRRRDSRVEYLNPGQRLSMASHWEFALRHVTDGMLCMLGDDDGLMPGAIQDLNAAIDAYPGTRALQRGISAYLYPDLPAPGAGMLTLEVDSEIEKRDSREWLQRTASSQVIYTELPSPYYGCVDASLLHDIRTRLGRLIHSQIPDAFLAVAVAASTEFYLHLGKPFTITGGSRHSTGFSGCCPGSPESSVKQFVAENDLPFHPALTLVKSVYVLQGEVCLRAKELGLAASDLNIGWDRVICRALSDFFAFDFSAEWRKTEVAKLQVLSGQVGAKATFDAMLAHLEAKQSSPQPATVIPPATLPLDSIATSRPVIHVSLTPMGVSNIAQAADAAKVIMESTCTVAAHFEPRLQRLEASTKKLRARLRSTHDKLMRAFASLQKAVDHLYASSRWKWSVYASSPSRWKTRRADQQLDRALQQVTDGKDKLSSILDGTPDE